MRVCVVDREKEREHFAEFHNNYTDVSKRICGFRSICVQMEFAERARAI